MEKRFTRSFAAILLLVVFCAILAGCAGPFSRPEPPGRGEMNEPEPMPGNQQEPTITLYNNETDQKEDIELETYLQGVVAGEMDASWPREALAAQAILARTFTMKKVQEGGVESRNADASTNVEEFQAYAPEEINDRVKEAVEETRGLVATHNDKYINAWFHACSGGRTAASAIEGLDFRNEETPYIHSVEDPGFEMSPPENRDWKAEYSLSEVRIKLQNYVGQDPGAIEEIAVLEKGPSGRATKVKVGDLTVSGPSLRLALGSTVMRSTLFDKLEIEGGRLIAEGRGYGHGVGMSQWGAKALAEDGRSAAEIVAYFYKDIEIQKAWD